jgi:hypothetical protein
VFGQTGKVHFVEDGILDWDFPWSIGLPIESVVHSDAFRGADNAIGGRLEVTGKGVAIGVDQASITIEPQAVLGPVGPDGLEVV